MKKGTINFIKQDEDIEPIGVFDFNTKRSFRESKNPTKTFIGGLVIGMFIMLAISAVFIDVVILK